MKVSVVIPCYRSASLLPALTQRLTLVLEQSTPGYEILLVVDGSPDNTWEVAHDLASRHAEIRAFRLSRNYGQHNALMAGIRAANHAVIVTMDDDLQHPPEEVPRLLEALNDGVDLVYGLPFEDEHGAFRNFASRSVKIAMARGMGIANTDSISAFRAFRTYLRDGFGRLSGPHASVDVALSWSTTRVSSISVRMDQRAEGRSNYSFRMLVRHAVNTVLGYSEAPLRLVGYLGFLCALLGVGILTYVLIHYFTGDSTVPGFTSLASMVAIFSGAQMIALAIVGEYVGRVHANSLGRPTYVVRERTDSDAHPDIISED